MVLKYSRCCLQEMFSVFILYDDQMGPVFIFFVLPLCVDKVKKPNGEKFSFFCYNLSISLCLCA